MNTFAGNSISVQCLCPLYLPKNSRRTGIIYTFADRDFSTEPSYCWLRFFRFRSAFRSLETAVPECFFQRLEFQRCIAFQISFQRFFILEELKLPVVIPEDSVMGSGRPSRVGCARGTFRRQSEDHAVVPLNEGGNDEETLHRLVRVADVSADILSENADVKGIDHFHLVRIFQREAVPVAISHVIVKIGLPAAG